MTVAAVVLMASMPAIASVASDADALVPAAKGLAEPYTRGLALGWLEIAARQDREVLVSHVYNDAAPKALGNAKHFIDGSVPFEQIYGEKHWPASNRPDWVDAIREIERVDERISKSPCKGESAGRLAALTDEIWKEQDETHGTRWVHGWSRIEDAKRIARKVDHELDACHVEPAVKTEVMTLAADANFAFDSAVLTSAGERAFREFATELKGRTVKRIVVTGYTDRFGGDAYNLELSRRRAETVAHALIAASVPVGQDDVRGMGSARPLADCPGPKSDAVIACLAPNRRVEVKVQSEPAEAVAGSTMELLQGMHGSWTTPWD
ncbi:OmpA family protein [Burkholderia ubonensis]|uniref:OmpA family protein n=1 Tax=Burkholderia ubonensis TaxID=101571 RepID=UPI001E2CB7AD|nr:OmpA family protein [Burkholderia ubonensis]